MSSSTTITSKAPGTAPNGKGKGEDEMGNNIGEKEIKAILNSQVIAKIKEKIKQSLGKKGQLFIGDILFNEKNSYAFNTLKYFKVLTELEDPSLEKITPDTVKFIVYCEAAYENYSNAVRATNLFMKLFEKEIKEKDEAVMDQLRRSFTCLCRYSPRGSDALHFLNLAKTITTPSSYDYVCTIYSLLIDRKQDLKTVDLLIEESKDLVVEDYSVLKDVLRLREIGVDENEKDIDSLESRSSLTSFSSFRHLKPNHVKFKVSNLASLQMSERGITKKDITNSLMFGCKLGSEQNGFANCTDGNIIIFFKKSKRGVSIENVFLNIPKTNLANYLSSTSIAERKLLYIIDSALTMAISPPLSSIDSAYDDVLEILKQVEDLNEQINDKWRESLKILLVLLLNHMPSFSYLDGLVEFGEKHNIFD